MWNYYFGFQKHTKWTKGALKFTENGRVHDEWPFLRVLWSNYWKLILPSTREKKRRQSGRKSKILCHFFFLVQLSFVQFPCCSNYLLCFFFSFLLCVVLFFFFPLSWWEMLVSMVGLKYPSKLSFVVPMKRMWWFRGLIDVSFSPGGILELWP